MRRLLGCSVVLGVAACAPQPRACPPRLRVEVGAVEPARFLAASIEAATAASATDFQALAGAVVTEGEQVGRFLDAPPDTCVAVVARAGSSIRDVDLFMFDDAGDVLASDEAPTSGAAVMLCPPHPRRVYLAARVVSGTGLLALGAFVVAPGRADEVGRALTVRGRPGQDTGKLAGWPGLEARLRERRAWLGSRWEDVRRAALPVDPHAVSSLSVKLGENRCLDVFASASEEVTGLLLEVLDSEGRVVSRGRATGAEQGLVVCSRTDEELTVQLRPRGARGTAAVVIATSPRGAIVELASHVDVVGTAPILPLPLALDRHRARMQGLALAGVVSVGQGTASVGLVQTMAVELAAGCSRIDVIGGAPTGRFRAELWAEGGELVDRSEGGPSAALFSCTRVPMRVRLEVVALEERGPFAIELRQGARVPLLEEHPRAAARLLQRLEAETGPVDFRSMAGVEALAITAERRHERSVSLTRECTRWLVASDGGTALVVDTVAQALEPNGIARGLGLAVHEVCADQPTEARLRVGASPASTVLLLRR